jgi:hypothetical protein
MLKSGAYEWCGSTRRVRKMRSIDAPCLWVPCYRTTDAPTIQPSIEWLRTRNTNGYVAVTRALMPGSRSLACAPHSPTIDRGLHGPMKARPIGGRYVARSRGALGAPGLAAAGTTRNSASLRRAARRGPNLAQHGPSLAGSSRSLLRLPARSSNWRARVHDGEPAQTSMQFAGMPGALRRGTILPGAQAAETAIPGRAERERDFSGTRL